jgi:SagB-type dehydrogenase family enzyme
MIEREAERAMSAPTLSLTPYASLLLADGEARVRSLMEEEGLATDDPGLLLVLQAFSRPRTPDAVAAQLASLIDPSDLRAMTDELRRVGLLVEGAAGGAWEPADLAFHQASTIISGPVKSSEPSSVPCARPAAGGPTTVLPEPSSRPALSLADAFARRRSCRRFASSPIPFEDFATLLQLTLRDQPGSPSGAVRRPYPSGGGTHSLEVHVVVSPGTMQALDPGVFRYSPARHELELVSAAPEALSFFVEAAAAMMGVPPPEANPFAVLLVTSRFRRVSDAYRKIAYRLVLMEVGCLFQSIYLAATTLGLGACALGGVPPREQLKAWLALDEQEEPAVGQLVIGVPA